MMKGTLGCSCEYNDEEIKDKLTWYIGKEKQKDFEGKKDFQKLDAELDAAEYACELGNIIKVVWTVNAEVSGVKCETPLKKKYVFEEQGTLQLDCEFVMDSHGRTVWKKDGENIKEDDKIQFTPAKYEFTIKNITQEDSGVYSCVYNGIQVTFNMKVTDSSKPPKVAPKMTCTFNIKPELAIRWLKDSGDLNTDDERIKVKSEALKSSLAIEKLTKKDKGSYTCEYGNKSTEFCVEVKELPKFLEDLKDKPAVKQNATVNLTCKLNRPGILVTWFKGKNKLPDDDRITVSRNGLECKLEIKGICKNDAGEYRCQCLDYPEVLTKCSIEVEEPPKFLECLYEKLTSFTWMQWLACLIVIIAVLIGLCYEIHPEGNQNDPYPTWKDDDLVKQVEDIDKRVSALEREQSTKNNSLVDMIKRDMDEVSKKNEDELRKLSKKIDKIELAVSSKVDENKLEETIEALEQEMRNTKDTLMSEIKDVRKESTALLKDLTEFKDEIKKDFSSHERSYNVFKAGTDEKMKSIDKKLEYLDTVELEFKQKMDTIADELVTIQHAREKIDVYLKSLQNDVDRIIPNTFNKEAIIAAFMVIIVVIIGIVIWVFKLQNSHSLGNLSLDGTLRNVDMSCREVLQQLPNRVTLTNSVCIVSFDEARQEAHERLIRSAFLTVGDIQMDYFVVRRHEHLKRLPRCKLYIMCTEFSERHVIIEEPGLGLGDLKRCTYEVIQRFRAATVILYTRDPGSRNLTNNLYNNKIYCVSKQPELLSLRDQGRFISTYDILTDIQKRALNDTIVNCLQ